MLTFAELLGRAQGLAAGDRRMLLGITGPPGAGKSTFAARLVAALDGRAVLVPMDGFHLADDVLIRRGRRDRKGAPDTFDVDGYTALLKRLQQATTTVYAPLFQRASEAAVAGAIEVPPDVPLVITEGNYLLYWPAVAARLDQTWYLDLPDGVRQQRLVDRRVGLGESAESARRWALGSDQANAEIVVATRPHADLVIPIGPPAGRER